MVAGGEKRLFFAANFNVDYLGETHICHRCFSCCTTDREQEDAQTATELANRRLASIYTSFDQAGITYNLVRLAVGLEDVEDLKADLQRGFDGIR